MWPVHASVGWKRTVTLPTAVSGMTSGAKLMPLVGTFHTPALLTVPVIVIFGFMLPRSNDVVLTRIRPPLTVPVVVTLVPVPVLTLRASDDAGPHATAARAAATDAASFRERRVTDRSCSPCRAPR